MPSINLSEYWTSVEGIYRSLEFAVGALYPSIDPSPESV